MIDFQVHSALDKQRKLLQLVSFGLTFDVLLIVDCHCDSHGATWD